MFPPHSPWILQLSPGSRAIPCASLDLPCSLLTPAPTLPKTPAISSVSADPSSRTPPWLGIFQPLPDVPAQPPGSPSLHRSIHPLSAVARVAPQRTLPLIFAFSLPGVVFVFLPFMKSLRAVFSPPVSCRLLGSAHRSTPRFYQ